MSKAENSRKKTTGDLVDLIGRQVRVYRNLHTKLISVQTYEPGKGWRVWGHVEAITLAAVTFKVYEKGRQKVVETRRKSVHAFVIGTVAPIPNFRPARVYYNPYNMSQFQFGPDCPVYKTTAAIVRADGGIEIDADGISEFTIV